jgi:hypothetical protein
MVKVKIAYFMSRYAPVYKHPRSLSARMTHAPERFQDEMFVKGANNAFCKGRTVDLGHSTDAYPSESEYDTEYESCDEDESDDDRDESDDDRDDAMPPIPFEILRAKNHSLYIKVSARCTSIHAKYLTRIGFVFKNEYGGFYYFGSEYDVLKKSKEL